MSILALRFLFEPLRELSFSSVGASYIAIGAPLTNPSRLFILQNLTDETVYISDDGVNNKFKFPPGGALTLDNVSNRTEQSSSNEMPQGTIWYVKHAGVAPTLGSITISTGYGSEV